MIVISTGCPAGVGPEVSLAAAVSARTPVVLVGDLATLSAAAQRLRMDPRRLVRFGGTGRPRGIGVLSVGPALSASDRRPGRPSARAGAAQLAYVDAAYDLVKATRGAALVTGPVSKLAIARSGAPGARRFTGHTEHLARRDGARAVVMCFAAPGVCTSLVTTHLPLSKVPRALTPAGVARAGVELARLLRALDVRRPRIAVCSLNPHAGEGELFGDEERRAIAPGIASARRALGGRVELTGPIGAESAYRKLVAGNFDGVVAMYHDQATIPMKLVAFGRAVNVTMGLSIVRTSVDHGTAYDIAWRERADPAGMQAAIALAERLRRASRGA